MVAVRFGRVDHSGRQGVRQITVKQEHHQQQQHQQHQQHQHNMFKVPACSQQQHHHHHQQQQQHQHAEMLAAAKRKWQEANSSASTTLELAAAERRPQRQKTSASPPLTIFYGGAVNVYENVPESMVRALMTLAAAKSAKPGAAAMLHHLQKTSSSNYTTTNNINVNSSNLNMTGANANSFGFQAAVSQPSTAHGLPVVQTLNSISGNTTGASGFSFPKSVSADCTSLSLNSFSSRVVDDKTSTTASPQPSTSSSAAAAAAPPPGGDPVKMNSIAKMQLLPPGLPQARRASIQRFLEKRKQKQQPDSANNAQVEDGDTGKNNLGLVSDVPHFLRLSS